MKTLATACLLSAIALLTFQCRKDSNPNSTGNPTTGSTALAPITATLQGNVLDETGTPSMGVLVTVGTATTTTDAHGYFRIVNAALDKNASLVTVQKTGYFTGYRTFCATSGVNQVIIKLIKRTLAGTIAAGSGGTITLSNGAKVSLPANGVVIASDSAAYSGTINVYASYIDPSSSDINKTIPGSFAGSNINGNRVALSSYGMLVVELETSAGVKLQMATGSKATLTTPIPSSLQSSAPATISLWYVNEQTGIWQEQGTATKTGTNYVGYVQHFSYWNCDYSIATSVSFTATFKTAGGVPLAYTEIVIVPHPNSSSTDSTTYSYCGYAHGYTDSLGQVSGYIPENVNLTIEIYDNCGNIIYSQNVGPFASTTDLGTITISNSTVSVMTVSGKLVDCNNNPVSNGFAAIYYNEYMVTYVSCNSTGDFSTSLTLCSASNANCQIVGTNGVTHQQGNEINVSLTSPSTNVGNIISCGTLVPYYITLTGILVDCNNVPVSNGYAIINYGGSTFNVTTSRSSDSVGHFSTSLYYMPDTIGTCQITGLNMGTGLEGNVTTITLSNVLTGTIANVGNIIACGTPVAANISYTIDGNTTSLLNPVSYFFASPTNTDDSTGGTQIPATTNVLIDGFAYGTNNGIEIDFRDSSTNTGPFYTMNSLYLSGFGQIGLNLPFNMNITHFAQSIGDYYTGSFSGQFRDLTDPNQTVHTITCTFNQPRTQ